MAITVPDTNTFSLQDVVNAVEAHAGDISSAETPFNLKDLKDAFARAKPLFFDPSYNNSTYAPANSMKRFRNYGHFSSGYDFVALSTDGMSVYRYSLSSNSWSLLKSLPYKMRDIQAIGGYFYLVGDNGRSYELSEDGTLTAISGLVNPYPGYHNNILFDATNTRLVAATTNGSTALKSGTYGSWSSGGSVTGGVRDFADGGGGIYLAITGGDRVYMSSNAGVSWFSITSTSFSSPSRTICKSNAILPGNVPALAFILASPDTNYKGTVITYSVRNDGGIVPGFIPTSLNEAYARRAEFSDYWNLAFLLIGNGLSSSNGMIIAFDLTQGSGPGYPTLNHPNDVAFKNNHVFVVGEGGKCWHGSTAYQVLNAYFTEKATAPKSLLRVEPIIS